jgi:phosphoketolase
MVAPLSPDLLRKMDAYWRAANYLSVGQIYLQDNPWLERSGVGGAELPRRVLHRALSKYRAQPQRVATAVSTVLVAVRHPQSCRTGNSGGSRDSVALSSFAPLRDIVKPS